MYNFTLDCTGPVMYSFALDRIVAHGVVAEIFAACSSNVRYCQFLSSTDSVQIVATLKSAVLYFSLQRL